jgi:hypothetical protein
MFKIFTILVFVFIAFFLLSGCGLYVRNYRSFEADEKKLMRISDSTFSYLTITPHHSERRVLLLYWSDIYSEPYRLDFVVESDLPKDSAVRVHEVVLRLHGEEIILHSKTSDPIEKKFSRKEEYKAYETLFNFDLQDRLRFDEDVEFEAVVLWSLSDDTKIRELKTKFKAVKSSDKSSIWSAMQGI